MPNYVCTTCGVEHVETEAPPEACRICEDERQFVNWQGQQWTTLGELRHGHCNSIRPEGPGLTGIGTEPQFAIGQRALLVESPAGNVLWDCVSLIDSATVAGVQDRGGLSAIAISHPHFYGSMVEWSRAFSGVPIYVHAEDRAFVMHDDPAIVYWSGDSHAISSGITLVRCGGHFPGSAVLHWAGGAGGRGAVLAGDTLMVTMDRRWLSFFYSYPNLIPLPGETVRRMAAALAAFDFEQIYGGWFGRNIASDGKGALERSVDRYLFAIGAAAHRA